MIHSEWMLATKLELAPRGFLSETLGARESNNLPTGMRHISIFLEYRSSRESSASTLITILFIYLCGIYQPCLHDDPQLGISQGQRGIAICQLSDGLCSYLENHLRFPTTTTTTKSLKLLTCAYEKL